MTHVAFIRAINVGGRAIVKMADLQRAFEDAGADDVQTYIQSGNVLFDAPTSELAQTRLFRAIQSRVDSLLGKRIDIIYRTSGELKQMIESDPFSSIDSRKDLKLYVAFLAKSPKGSPKLPLRSDKDGIEVIRIAGPDVFVVSHPVGQGRYGAPNLFIEKAFSCPATSRNWNTVRKIVMKREQA
ncbi:MAG: DUF1697 domain-containing protein [Candidatus Zixiibacteriota bacterium]